MPSDFSFEPRSPRYGPFLVLGQLDTNCTYFGSFLAIFGPFLGHIVELEGNKRALCHKKLKAHVEFMHPFPSFVHFEWVSRLFWPKKAVLGHKIRSFGRAPPDLAPPPRGATGEFLAQNLESARALPRV